MFKKVLSNDLNNKQLGKDNILDKNQACVIAEGTRIEGVFRATENVRLDGEIIGKVECEKKLVIGQQGKISGTLTSNSSAIQGEMDGDMIIGDTIHLMEDANVTGTISAKSLVVESGAIYNGKCEVGRKEYI